MSTGFGGSDGPLQWLPMSRRSGLVLLLALAAAFLLMNRGAYQGFFENDDMGTLGWTPSVRPLDYAKIALSLEYQPNNFRPVGHFYYRVMEHFFGLSFAKYVFALQLIHLVNVWLLWIFIRSLGTKLWPAAAACTFYAFHMALFETFWKPMYVFDVLCGTFCLLSLLAWSRRNWVLSFAAFWLAYKSKELAVMLPIVLACYEYWFGKRQWQRLAPFFLVSLSFGLQGILLNPSRGQENNYTFHFTLAALAKTNLFYGGKVFLVPYLGLAAPFAALFHRERRVWLGLVMLGAFFLPVLLLPGRLHGAYCYVPFTGLAVAFAGIAEFSPPAVVLAFLLLWIPVDFRELRRDRRAARAVDDEVREWFHTVVAFARTSPGVDAAVYAGTPAGMDSFGVEGALRYLVRGGDFGIGGADGPDASKLRQRDRVVILNWDYLRRRLEILLRTPETPDAAYVEMNPDTPVWQLGEGWYGPEGAYRWTAPDATARLTRPAEARSFALRVNVAAKQLQTGGPVTMQITLGDSRLSPWQFTSAGWQEARWDVPAAPAGAVRVRFHVEPGYSVGETRVLGLAVGAFGFEPPHSSSSESNRR
jgi:hypothetical protein